MPAKPLLPKTNNLGWAGIDLHQAKPTHEATVKALHDKGVRNRSAGSALISSPSGRMSSKPYRLGDAEMDGDRENSGATVEKE